MKPKSLIGYYKSITIIPVLILSGVTATAQQSPFPEANNSIMQLESQRSAYAVKRDSVKVKIDSLRKYVIEPQLLDITNQNKQMATHVKAGYDANSQTSVDNYNKRLAVLHEWADSIDARKKRHTDLLFDMQRRQADFAQKTSMLELQMKNLIKRYRPDCLDNNANIEAIVNCWGIFFDGESKKDPLAVTVPPGTRAYSQGTPDADAFKTYRNKQLDDINRGIKNIVVPAPEPPQKGAIEKLTDEVKKYFNEYMNKSERYKEKRTNKAVMAVRG